MSMANELKLVPMSDESFAKFKRVSVEYYSLDRSIAEQCSIEFAKQATANQLEAMTSQGTSTPAHFFFDIVLVMTEEHIGHLWIGTVVVDGKTIARINDFFINEAARSKGYGRQTLHLAEKKAKTLGASKMHLHAFKHNERAVNLYESFGFHTVSLTMAKDIH